MEGEENFHTFPSLPGSMEILTLPMREGILYSPYQSGMSMEILPLSVRVSIGMFSAHIKEYGNASPQLKESITVLSLSSYIGMLHTL